MTQRQKRLLAFIEELALNGSNVDHPMLLLKMNFPKATVNDLKVVMAQFTIRHEARQAQLKHRMEVASQSVSLMQRFPAATFGESLELGLAAGDAFAIEAKRNGVENWMIPVA